MVGCGSTSSPVSGISALQNLEHLEIEVGDSLGTIGKLRALTRLCIQPTSGLGPLYELHLETPKLQCLYVEAGGNNDMPVRSIVLLCTSLYNFRRVYHHCHPMGGCYLQDERMWRCLSSLTTLQELHTYNLNLVDIPGEVLQLTQLTSLHHEECDCYGLSCCMDLSPLQHLVELDISGSNIRDIPVMLKTCQSLEVVKMGWCDHLRLRRAGINVLKTLPHLKRVRINHRFNPVAQRSMTRSAQDGVRMARFAAGGL